MARPSDVKAVSGLSVVLVLQKKIIGPIPLGAWSYEHVVVRTRDRYESDELPDNESPDTHN